jgi:hypothetical protein
MFRAFICGVVVALLGSGAVARAGELFSFVLPWNDAAVSATNVSTWLDAPAGRDGFATVKDGHLFASGKRLRLFGVNLGGGACFPSHEAAEMVAGRLAKFGVNCVRFVDFDGGPAPAGIWNQEQTAFEAAQLDRLDYFIAQLKTRGIYVDLVLHSGRAYPDRPASDKTGNPPDDAGVDNFSQKLIALQKEYARELLTHVNPYTKAAYFDEPAIALIEINHESSLIALWHSGGLDKIAAPYRAELTALWTEWLRKKYGDEQTVSAAWIALAKEDGLDASVPRDAAGGIAPFTKADIGGRTERARDDWERFLWQMEERYWPGMHRYLREDLKARSLIIGTPLGSSPFLIQQHMDVLSGNAVWRAPGAPRPPQEKTAWRSPAAAMSGRPDGGTLPGLALQRVEGKPYICTEYSHPRLAPYAAEAFPLAAAYAALQDWDGVFVNCYAKRADDWGRGSIPGFYEIDQHPVAMAMLPASVALFTRGDVAPAKSAAIASIQHDIAVGTTRERGPQLGAEQFGVKRMETLRHRVGVRLGDDTDAFVSAPEPAGPRFTSDTKELTWDTEDRVVTINTPRSKGIVGFIAKRAFTLDDVQIASAAGRDGFDFGAIFLTVLDGADLKTASRVLVTATSYAQNTGEQWTSGDPGFTDYEWGEAPTLVEGVTARITLPVSPMLKAWVLDERGQRRAEIPFVDGVLQISPACRTLWYEIAK